MFLQSYLGTMQGGEICGYTTPCSEAGLLQDLYHRCSHEDGADLLSLMEHQPLSTHRIMGKRGKKLRQGCDQLRGDIQPSLEESSVGDGRWSMDGWSVENYLLLCELQVCETHHQVRLRAARSHNCQPRTLGIFTEKECVPISHCHSPYNDTPTHRLLLKASATPRQGTNDAEGHSITFAHYCFAHRALEMSA